MTEKQMRQYRVAVAMAAAERGLKSKEEIEEYRKAVLLEETGKASSKEVGNGSEYEGLMRRHYADAGQWEMAAMYCGGDEKRFAAMADDCARQIVELKGWKEGDSLHYLRGVLERMGFERRPTCGDSWWMDYPAATPRTVFLILDTYRRSLVRKLGNGKVSVAYRFGTMWKK